MSRWNRVTGLVAVVLLLTLIAGAGAAAVDTVTQERDQDNDGLNATEEEQYRTNATVSGTDADELDDGAEIYSYGAYSVSVVPGPPHSPVGLLLRESFAGATVITESIGGLEDFS